MRAWSRSSKYFFHLFAILISIGGRSMKAVALISIFWDGKNYSLPPRVVAQGYMSDGAACAVALIAGVLFILIATFGIRHVSGFPAFFPDLFNRL